MCYAGQEAILTVLTKPDAKLDLIFPDLQRAAETIAALI